MLGGRIAYLPADLQHNGTDHKKISAAQVQCSLLEKYLIYLGQSIQETCGRQPLKNLKGYGPLMILFWRGRTYALKNIFKILCLPRIFTFWNKWEIFQTSCYLKRFVCHRRHYNMLQISGVKALSDIPVYYIIYIAKNVRLVITENNFLSHVIFFNKTWLGPLNKNVPGVIWSYFILQLFKTSNFSVNIASNHGTAQSTVFSLMSASTISSAYIPRRFKYTWCIRRAGTDYISDS